MFYHIPASGHYASLPLLVELVGISHLQEPIHRPHGLPEFQWFSCVKGSGEFVISGQKSVLSKDQGLFIAADAPHSYRGLTPDFTVDFIGFRGTACREILQALHMTETGVYHFSDVQVFPKHMEKMKQLMEGEKAGKEIRLSKECYSMLLDLAPCIQKIQKSSIVSEDKRVQKMIDFLEESYAQPFSLTELAEHLNLSKEYICSLFKKEMQQTILQYLQSVRIARARVLLLQYPEKRVTEIAHLCGFESISYFGRVFKKICGCTPEMFRRQNGGYSH